MKKRILVLVIAVIAMGASMVLLPSASKDVTTVVTTKPLVPKQVVAIYSITISGAIDDIEKYTKKGWILKSNSGTETGWITVLEKY